MTIKVFNGEERKILTLASLGGMLEFYDFIIYGIFSHYFAHQFFPSHNQWIVIMQSYLVFVLGYFARPIGGIIFSHIGDEYGRKKVLIITIILMGAASIGIGLLPTYAKWGLLAPIVLMSLRLLQGLALGGELPSTYVYISETLCHDKGLAFGIVMAGVNAGLLLGMIINSVLNYLLTYDQLMAFGWRIPFIIGGLACIVSYRIRKSLHETSVFIKIHDKPKIPLVYLFKHHFREFVSGTAFVAFMAGFVVVAIIFMPTYLKDMLKLNNHFISQSMVILTIVNLITIFLTGLLAQKFNPTAIIKTGLLACILFVPLSYFLMHHNHVLMGMLILGCLQGMSAMLTPYILTDFFETKIHLTGVALTYNIGFTLFGGLSPFLITKLISMDYNIYVVPACYLLMVVLICSLGLRFVKKSA